MNRCTLCPGIRNLVHSDGPLTARIFAIGEAPGRTEDQCGVPFSGAAGIEYNRNYLRLAGLDRHDIRQSNAVLCRPDENKKPSDELARVCAEHHLKEELLEVWPEIVVLLGATAVNTLAPGTDLDSQHGIPFQGQIYAWFGWIVPMWHPASGLHNTSMMTPMLEDWTKLKPWLETGVWQWGVDQIACRDYRLARTIDDVHAYFEDYPFDDHFGGDSESHDGPSWSLQVTTKVGTGIMVLCEDIEVMHWLGATLNVELRSRPELCLVLHNAEADLDLFKQVSGFDIVNYRDTMQEAYQLQNLPQALKALSFRLLGRRRQGWKEIVGGASRSALLSWMWQAREYAVDNMRQLIPQFSLKTGKPIKPKLIKSPIEKIMNHVMLHTGKTQGEKPYDPWKYFKSVEPTVQYMVGMSRIVNEIGPMPKLGIANCSLDVARDYGISDADDTLALAGVLKQLRIDAEAGWDVQDRDVDGLRVENVALVAKNA